MACGSCSNRRAKREASRQVYDVMGGYKNLPDRQLKARLESFKRIHCKDCEHRYTCDFTMYSNCTKKVTT